MHIFILWCSYSLTYHLGTPYQCKKPDPALIEQPDLQETEVSKSGEDAHPHHHLDSGPLRTVVQGWWCPMEQRRSPSEGCDTWDIGPMGEKAVVLMNWTKLTSWCFWTGNGIAMWLGMFDLFLSKNEALPENSQKYQMRVEHFQKLGFLHHQLGAKN